MPAVEKKIIGIGEASRGVIIPSTICEMLELDRGTRITMEVLGKRRGIWRHKDKPAQEEKLKMISPLAGRYLFFWQLCIVGAEVVLPTNKHDPSYFYLTKTFFIITSFLYLCTL